jgi:hypothetical protein
VDSDTDDSMNSNPHQSGDDSKDCLSVDLTLFDRLFWAATAPIKALIKALRDSCEGWNGGGATEFQF